MTLPDRTSSESTNNKSMERRITRDVAITVLTTVSVFIGLYCTSEAIGNYCAPARQELNISTRGN